MKSSPKNAFVRLLLSASVALAFTASQTQAAILYYDGGTANIAGNGNGAASAVSGNWNTTLQNWDTGVAPYVAWNNSSNDTAFFNAGTAFAAPTPGTIALTEAITTGGIIFNTSGYTISGSTLTFGGTNNTVALNNLVTAATISSAIGTSSANVTFSAQNPIGAATLTFGAAGGWTGTTRVNPGLTLQLNSASTALLGTSAITLNGGVINQNATSNADRISDSAAISSYGGTLSTNNTSGANVYNEAIGAVTLNSGLTSFVHNTNQAGAGTQTITISSLTRTGVTNTSAVNFASAGGLNGTKNFIAVTGAVNTTAGQIIGPWATTGNTAGANDYAVYAAGQVAQAGATLVAGGEGSWTVSTDAYNNNVVTQTLTATRTIAALRNSAASAATLTLASSANLETNGLLNGASTTLTVAATGTGTLTTPSGGGYLHLNAGNGTTGATITVSAPVTNNSGAVSVVKSGLGTLNLTGANTFTGGINVNSGTVSVTGSNTFATGASGADVINGGALTYANAAAIGGSGRDLTFNGTGTFTLSAGSYTGGTLTSNAGANAVINEAASGATISFATTTGSGNIIYTIGSTGSRALNLGNASTFSGNLQGRLTNNANQGTNNVITFSSINDATGSAIQFVGGTGDGAQPFTFAFNGSGALTFTNRQIQILQHVTGNNDNQSNILANNSSAATSIWTINTDLLATGGRAGQFNSTGTAQFVLSGTNTGDNKFAGVINDGQYGQGANGNIGLTKAGVGKWIVSGNNTYSGATNVSAGTLNIQHANALGSTSVGTTVSNGAILQLQGGITTAAEPLTLTPGTSGTAMLLNVSGNNLWSGSITANTATNTNVSRIQSDLDKLTVSGAVSLTGSAHQLVLQGAGDTEISGQISGVGRVSSSITGSGIRILSGNNIYTGDTLLNGSTLRLGNANALGFGGLQSTATGVTTVSSGAVLDLNGTATVAEPINLAGTGISSGGALINNTGTAIIGSGIAGITIPTASTGTGYSAPPTVNITGTGTGATATATLGVTAATFGTVTVVGTYTAPPTVTITGGGGTGATATVTNAGVLTITNPGTGYTTAPTITFTGGTGGTSMSATANASNFTVTGVNMTAAGSGYTGSPTYTFSGGDATPGALTLSRVVLTGDSSVGGSGNITVNAVVSESGGARALTKVGAGTVTLGGANTYTGTTTISGGTLALGANNVLPDTSNISIGTATLDASANTVAETTGTLDPTAVATINIGTTGALAFANSSAVDWTGGTLNITGTLGATSIRFGSNSSGLTPTQLGLISVNGAGAGTYSLDGSGYLVSAGGAPEIAVDQGGNINSGGSKTFATTTIGSNTSLVFTINNTGSSALNLTGSPNLVAVSGPNASEFTITSAPSASIAASGSTTFTVQFAPTGSGTRNAILTIANNDSDEGTFTINVSGTGQTPYEAWASGAAFDADANGDGVKNGLAFLLGASGPGVSALSLLPTVSESSGNLTMTFNMLNSAARGTATLNLMHSSDVGVSDPWTSVSVTDSNSGPTSGVTFTVTPGSPTNAVSATISSSEAAGGKLFGRLEANTP